MKKYVLIGGVNGAGKSTLYQTTQGLKTMKRVNTDELVKEIGDWRNLSDVISAGKVAVKLIDQYFTEGISFNQETTLCGRSVIKNIRRAKALGYIVELHYIGVDSVEIAKQRVKNRVEKGGHGIPERDIEKRYYESFQNLKEVLDECNLVAFYDNTEEFRRFAIYKNGENVVLSHKVPKWYSNLLLGRKDE
jgi:predicted ABC-type ATPase